MNEVRTPVRQRTRESRPTRRRRPPSNSDAGLRNCVAEGQETSSDTETVDQSCQSENRSQEAAWDDLKSRFLHMLSLAAVDSETATSWNDVWRLVVCHPCYQRELDQRAKRLLFQRHLPLQWLPDIRQETLVIFAGNLQRRIAVNRRPLVVGDHFVAWMRCVITRDCRHALRRLQRLFGQDYSTVVEQRAVFDWPAIDDELDLLDALEDLREPARTAARLRTAGASVNEIAQRLHVSQRTTYRLLAGAFRQLRQRMGVDMHHCVLPSAENSSRMLAESGRSVP